MNNSKFTNSGINNPCPICERTKDKDCRISDDLVLCHHNYGDTCPDGWKYLKPSNDDRTGIFVRAYLKADRPWGQTFKHEYKYFDSDRTATQRRYYDAKTQKKDCKWTENGVTETDLMPYKWELVNNADPIFIVEGELKADDLIDRGLLTTSCRLWADRQASLFTGKTVVLILDCDREGIEKLGKAAALLTKHGATVKYCYLPKIGNWQYPPKNGGLDSYDYFRLGGTVDELRDYITDQPLEFKSDRFNAGEDTEPTEKPPKVFDLLMAILSELYLFKQDSESGDTYVDVVSNDVRRTFRLRSKDFKSWLSKELYSRHAKPANSEALETCLKVCEGFSTENINSVWMRTAECDGKIYFDLCNSLWQAVEVSKQGWRVVDSRDLPIRFVRSPMQIELPTPNNQNDLNHSLVRLFELLSIAEESKPLVLGWLLSALVPTGDKPILVLSAPKGSGKSTIAKFLVNLIDHTKASLLPAVGDRRAMAVQAKHRWILAYDNLSHLSTEQQDAMCCASTGAGYIERQLFTDNDITFVEYRRPQILTSVDLVPTRSDLLDRCLLVKVKPLPECDRKTNEELDQLFKEIHGDVIGGLFNLLVTALGNLDKVKQPLQRMASFHKLALAAEIPNFHHNYLASVSNAQESAVRANPVAEAISELGNFNGTAQELVTKLKEISDDSKLQKLTSRTLGKLLNGTLKSDLQAIGVTVDNYRLAKGSHWLIGQPDKPDKQVNLTTQTTLTTQPSLGKGLDDVVKNQQNLRDYTDYTKPDQLVQSEVQLVQSEENLVNLTTPPEPSQGNGYVVSVVNAIKNDYLSGQQTDKEQNSENDPTLNNGVENHDGFTDF